MKFRFGVFHRWQFLGDPNVCVLRDEILFKLLLTEENISITIKYFVFSVLIFTDVVGLRTNNNCNVIQHFMCHNIIN